MVIPTNNVKDTRKEDMIKKIIDCLGSKDSFTSYKMSNNIPLDMAREICEEFVNAGYHAKIVFFADGRKAYQRFEINKYRCSDSQARMIYSEIIG